MPMAVRCSRAYLADQRSPRLVLRVARMICCEDWAAGRSSVDRLHDQGGCERYFLRSFHSNDARKRATFHPRDFDDPGIVDISTSLRPGDNERDIPLAQVRRPLGDHINKSMEQSRVCTPPLKLPPLPKVFLLLAWAANDHLLDKKRAATKAELWMK